MIPLQHGCYNSLQYGPPILRLKFFTSILIYTCPTQCGVILLQHYFFKPTPTLGEPIQRQHRYQIVGCQSVLAKLPVKQLHVPLLLAGVKEVPQMRVPMQYRLVFRLRGTPEDQLKAFHDSFNGRRRPSASLSPKNRENSGHTLRRSSLQSSTDALVPNPPRIGSRSFLLHPAAWIRARQLTALAHQPIEGGTGYSVCQWVADRSSSTMEKLSVSGSCATE